MQTLEGMGLERRHLLIEFPTVGFHLLLFFDGPVAGAALKRVMRFVLAQCGLDKVPFYPKKVEGPGWGDRVQLPLRINLNTGRRSNFVRDLDTFDPEHYGEEPDFAVLDRIDLIDSQWIDEVMRRYRLE
jgi:hypothetical protein